MVEINNLCRKCRREGKKLFLKGEKCTSPKCPFIRRSYSPGQHGQMGRRVSEYALQLREKQKMKRIYGLREHQFKNYFKKAASAKGIIGENLIQLLERRLDNIVYRLGLTSSRQGARQLVSHGHFLVNSKKVNIPSYLIKEGDEITIAQRSKNSAYFENIFKKMEKEKLPPWLKWDPHKKKGKIIRLPEREEIPSEVDESLIVEFYSR